MESTVEDLTSKITEALKEGNSWMAYNTLGAFEKGEDVYFFKHKADASAFSEENIGDYDSFNVLHIKSVSETIQRLTGFSSPEQSITLPMDHDQSTSIYKISKFTTMNEKNYEFLKDQLKYTGFGESANNELREKLLQQSPEFKIFHKQDFGQDHAVATLHFKKSEQSDMYFFNKYDLHLKNDKNDQVAKQTFYIGKGNNITLKEGYNLMNGRAVNKDLSSKEGLVYNAWMKMNFKETDAAGNYQINKFHQNYGFDLQKELAKHPIKELNNEQDKARLLESLQRGNRQTVTIIKEGSEQKVFIEANPKFKTVNMYDQNMQRIQSQSQKERSAAQQSAKQEAKKESQHQVSEDENTPKASRKKSRSKKQSIS